MRNFCITDFWKNSVKTISLVKSFSVKSISRKILKWYKNFTNSTLTLWKLQKFTLTENKFRQINYLVISLVNTLLSRNFCQKRVRVNFRNTVTLWYRLLCNLFSYFSRNQFKVFSKHSNFTEKSYVVGNIIGTDKNNYTFLKKCFFLQLLVFTAFDKNG